MHMFACLLLFFPIRYYETCLPETKPFSGNTKQATVLPRTLFSLNLWLPFSPDY